MSEPGPVVGLAAVQPAELGHRERSDRDAADGGRPVGSATRQLLRSAIRIRRGLGVVPQLGRTDHLTVGIENHHAVLLAARR